MFTGSLFAYIQHAAGCLGTNSAAMLRNWGCVGLCAVCEC